MRRFVDLHLRPPINDPHQVSLMIQRASELGYRMVAIPLPPNVPSETVDWLRNLCRGVGLDFVTRVNLTPQGRGELLKSLRKLRRRFEVVSVFCSSKLIARQAAKDRRVDLLDFPADPKRRFFDQAEARLASEASAALELNMADLILLDGPSRIRLISRLRREVETAKGLHVPVVISSGAGDERLLRAPRDYAALTTLFDMERSDAIQAISKIPLSIVQRNREKLSPDYVVEGVRVVRRGRDCR